MKKKKDLKSSKTRIHCFCNNKS